MTKKSFTTNTALQILEDENTITTENVEAQEQQGQSLNFVYRKKTQELKTKRMQLVLKPSTYEKLKATAKANHTSINDYVGQLLETVLQG